MALDIRGQEKPVYAEGQKVFFDVDGVLKGTGRIRGRASEHLIDFWIVEVEVGCGIDRNQYPWSCITVPHTLIRALGDTPTTEESR